MSVQITKDNIITDIRIQLDKGLIAEDVIGTLVSEENSDIIVGEIIGYDTITGIAVCKLYTSR